MTITLPVQVTSTAASRISFERDEAGERPFLSFDLQVKISIPELLDALVKFQKDPEKASNGAVLDTRVKPWIWDAKTTRSKNSEQSLAKRMPDEVVTRPQAVAGQPSTAQWLDDDYGRSSWYDVPPIVPPILPSFAGGPAFHGENAPVWQGWHSGSKGAELSQQQPMAMGKPTSWQQSRISSHGGANLGKLDAAWQPVALLEKHTAEVTSVAWAPDGKYLATVSCDNTLCMWNVTATPEVACTLRGSGPAARFTAVAWAPDSNKVITGSNDKAAQIWRCCSASEWFVWSTLRRHTKSVVGVCWSGDGTKVGTCSVDGSAIIWRQSKDQGFEILHTLRGPGKKIKAMAWSPNDQFVVTCGGDNIARLWDVSKPTEPECTCLASLDGHTAEILSVAYSPEGTRILTGSTDSSAWVWCWQASDQTAVANSSSAQLRGHSAEVRAVAWSPSGHQVATGGQDKLACVWREIDEVQNKWMLITTIREHSAVVLSVAWSPDGSLLLTGSGDNKAAIWREAGEVHYM